MFLIAKQINIKKNNYVYFSMNKYLNLIQRGSPGGQQDEEYLCNNDSYGGVNMNDENYNI